MFEQNYRNEKRVGLNWVSSKSESTRREKRAFLKMQIASNIYPSVKWQNGSHNSIFRTVYAANLLAAQYLRSATFLQSTNWWTDDEGVERVMMVGSSSSVSSRTSSKLFGIAIAVSENVREVKLLLLNVSDAPIDGFRCVILDQSIVVLGGRRFSVLDSFANLQSTFTIANIVNALAEMNDVGGWVFGVGGGLITSTFGNLSFGWRRIDLSYTNVVNPALPRPSPRWLPSAVPGALTSSLNLSNRFLLFGGGISGMFLPLSALAGNPLNKLMESEIQISNLENFMSANPSAIASIEILVWARWIQFFLDLLVSIRARFSDVNLRNQATRAIQFPEWMWKILQNLQEKVLQTNDVVLVEATWSEFVGELISSFEMVKSVLFGPVVTEFSEFLPGFSGLLAADSDQTQWLRLLEWIDVVYANLVLVRGAVNTVLSSILTPAEQNTVSFLIDGALWGSWYNEWWKQQREFVGFNGKINRGNLINQDSWLFDDRGMFLQSVNVQGGWNIGELSLTKANSFSENERFPENLQAGEWGVSFENGGTWLKPISHIARINLRNLVRHTWRSTAFGSAVPITQFLGGVVLPDSRFLAVGTFAVPAGPISLENMNQFFFVGENATSFSAQKIEELGEIMNFPGVLSEVPIVPIVPIVQLLQFVQPNQIIFQNLNPVLIKSTQIPGLILPKQVTTNEVFSFTAPLISRETGEWTIPLLQNSDFFELKIQSDDRALIASQNSFTKSIEEQLSVSERVSENGLASESEATQTSRNQTTLALRITSGFVIAIWTLVIFFVIIIFTIPSRKIKNRNVAAESS